MSQTFLYEYILSYLNIYNSYNNYNSENNMLNNPLILDITDTFKKLEFYYGIIYSNEEFYLMFIEHGLMITYDEFLESLKILKEKNLIYLVEEWGIMFVE